MLKNFTEKYTFQFFCRRKNFLKSGNFQKTGISVGYMWLYELWNTSFKLLCNTNQKRLFSFPLQWRSNNAHQLILQFLWKPHFDICSTDHHFTRNSDICAQDDTYDSIPMLWMSPPLLPSLSHKATLVCTCPLIIHSALSSQQWFWRERLYYKVS